jgi:thiamine-phosphate pyrophosphorylase
MLMTLKRQSSQKRKLLAAARVAEMHLPAGVPPVFFLTDPDRTPDPARIARQLPPGWGVIYRHFGAANAPSIAADLANICHARDLRLLISSDPELAHNVGADGVHWPFARLAQSRRWKDRFALMTASAHAPADLRALIGFPIDAALVSTIFPSASSSAGAPIGALRLRQLVRSAPCPVFALGGVTSDNAIRISAFAGFAAIEALTTSFSS